MPFDVMVPRLDMDPAPGICVARSLQRAGKVTLVNRTSRQSSFESQLEGRASVMRRNPTVSESALWLHLAGKRLGVAFRRQVPLDRYIVDFLAPSVQLIVEVDGLWHHRCVAADERRDRKLARLGYRILHLDAALVMRQPLAAVERIREAVAAAQR